MCAVVAVPASAGVYGSLANFDVVNDTGETAHGFEIDIEGITPSEITSLFGDASRWPGMERYGSPVVTSTGTGVKIVYEATYGAGGWSSGTPSGTLPVSPSDSCWPYGAPSYGPNYPCDHFGVSTSVATPNVTYKWLVEATPGSSTLVPVLATVPNPVWTVGPVVIVNNVPQPPAVNVVIVAPQPLGYEFGEPRWVKVTATGTVKDVAVEDLVAENAVLKKAQTQVQMEWQLLQVDSGSPGSGQIDLTGVALDPGATGVVYRFEFYKYTGQRDPATNEALVGPNGDTPGAIGPSPGDLGAFIVAQNAGINFDGKIPAAPPLPIAPTLNASIAGGEYGVSYSQVISATPGNPGDTLTYAVTGLPAGLTLTGNTISGSPTAIGTFPLTITVTDTTNSTSTSGSTNLIVGDSPIVFASPFTLAPATVGTAYSQTINITGGVAPYTFAEPTNKLATVGLALVGNAITGTPTTTGTPSVTIQVTDHLGCSNSATATLTVSAVGVPVACSATNKVITSVGASSIDIGGGKGNPGGQTATLPASINYVSPASSLVNGELASFTGTVDGSGNCTAVSMTIAPGLSLGNPTALPDGQVGVAYATTDVVPAGGVGPFTVSVSGLPNALSFDGTAISGTPSVGLNGVYSVVISVSDSVGETVHTNLSLTIAAPPAITLGTINLPANGYKGVAYSGSASASGGIGTLTWKSSGLPAGVTITPDGTISGTPTLAGTYHVTLRVTDSIGQVKTTTGTVVLATDPAIVWGTLNVPAAGYAGFAYTGSVAATGGTGALTWTAVGLPDGVTIGADGTISGNPSSVAAYVPTITVTDSVGLARSFRKNISILAAAPVVMGAVRLPATGYVGRLYTGSASASGGVHARTWSATGLPGGVSITSGGVISGTPLSDGVFAVTLTVQDGIGQVATYNQTVTIKVVPPIVIGKVSLPASLINAPYKGGATATGGVGALKWTATGLPTGVSLSVGGILSGTPTVLGVSPVVLTVTDTFGQTQTVNGSITIADFTVTTADAGVIVTRGSSSTESVTVGALSGFNGSVALTVSGLPTGCKGVFTPATVTGSGVSALKLTPAATTLPGTYTLTVTDTGGAQPRTATLSLTVQ